MAVRKCTRCRDANGSPTGIVCGGECFLCHGTGTFTRETVSRAVREAGTRRMAAINMLRAATLDHPRRRVVLAARCDLEELAPDRHALLIDSVLAGRIDATVDALLRYAREMEIR